jgi:hypothetical protein
VRVLLLDVDSKIPNIALGRLSTFYKGRGAEVEYRHLGFSAYPRGSKAVRVLGAGFDRVFASVTFAKNRDRFAVLGGGPLMVGGVGSAKPHRRLPVEVDACEVDYSLWPDNDASYGFMTRGCVRKCPFCMVPKAEGGIRFERDPDDIIRHDKVLFLDNNFLAWDGHLEMLGRLADRGTACDFNQGLDIRLVNEENAAALARLNYINEYVFAFDDLRLERQVARGLATFRRHVPRKWATKFFVYHDAETMDPAETIYRVFWLKAREALPYVMRNSNYLTSPDRELLVDFTAWANQPHHFKNQSFSKYMVRTRYYMNLKRVKRVLDAYRAARSRMGADPEKGGWK